MKRYRLTVALAAALALAACSGGDDAEMEGGPRGTGDASASGAQQAASAPAGTEERVVVQNNAFDPEELTVTVGTTVTWVNEDEQGHTVTHGEAGAPDPDALFDEALSAGQTVTYTFEEPGTYPVTCKVHQGMQMTVIVEEGS